MQSLSWTCANLLKLNKSVAYFQAASESTVKQQFFVKALPQQSDELEKEAIFSKEAWLYDTLLGELQDYCMSMELFIFWTY